MNYNVKKLIFIVSLFFSTHSLCAAAGTEGLSPELLAKVQAIIVKIESEPQPLSAEKQELLENLNNMILFEEQRLILDKQLEEDQKERKKLEERLKKFQEDAEKPFYTKSFFYVFCLAVLSSFKILDFYEIRQNALQEKIKKINADITLTVAQKQQEITKAQKFFNVYYITKPDVAQTAFLIAASFGLRTWIKAQK